MAHNGERGYQCQSCDKAYTNPSHLKRHVDRSHVEGVGRNHCPEEGCQVVCQDKRKLTAHLRTIHRKDMLKCPHDGCDRTFAKKSQLKTHSYAHTAVKPYCCPQPGCPLTFLTPSHVRRHQKVHEGYLCREEGCDQRFYKWTILQQHVKSQHPRKTKYVCGECGHEFSHKPNLTQHVKIHQEVRDVHACPYTDCGRYYYDAKNLRAHVRSYHEGERFRCTVEGCGKGLVTKACLLKHLAAIHGQSDKHKKSYKSKSHRKRSLAKRLSANMAALGFEMQGNEEERDDVTRDECDVIKLDDAEDVHSSLPEPQPSTSHMNTFEEIEEKTMDESLDIGEETMFGHSHATDISDDLHSQVMPSISVKLSSTENVMSLSAIQNLDSETSVIVAPLRKKDIVRVQRVTKTGNNSEIETETVFETERESKDSNSEFETTQEIELKVEIMDADS